MQERKIEMATNSVTNFYSHDHDELDQHFKKFQEIKETDFKNAEESFEKFKHGLERHIEWEESILFPLFEDKTGMKDHGPTAVMRHEHTQIKQHLHAIHEKLLKDDLNTDQEEESLLETLQAHNQKEESILYPAIDNVASEEEKRAVFKSMKIGNLEGE